MPKNWANGNDGKHEWQVIGYMGETGAVIQGVPSKQAISRDGDVIGVHVQINPVGDREAARYFWTMNMLGGTPDTWVRDIQRTARNTKEVHFDIDVTEYDEVEE